MRRILLAGVSLLALVSSAQAQSCGGTPNANQICAAPNGSSGFPSFRAQVNGDLPTSPANSVKGSIAGGTPTDLTATQLTTLCNTVTGSLSGCVPSFPNTVTTFFRGDGTYNVPPTVTSGAPGYAPAFPNNTTTFFRGDGTYTTVSPGALTTGTRGSILEQGASGWQAIVPGTSGLPWVSNGAGADPAYQALTGGGIASGTVANSNLANMAALSVKCNLTGSSAVPTDCTSLPNPFSAGTSLYPVTNGFEYSASSAFIANSLGAKGVFAGVPAATSTCCTWLNTYLSGVDVVGVTTNYSIAPPGSGSLWTSVTAARSSDSSAVSAQNIIPLNCVEVHDNTTVAHFNWCGYDAAYITATATHSRTIGREISVFNSGTASNPSDPFTINPTVPSTDGLRIDCAAGGGFGGNDCGTAINIVNNGAKFIGGLNVTSTALDTAVNTVPPAVSLPNQFGVVWYASAGTVSARAYNGSDGLLHLFSTGAVAPQGATPTSVACTGLGTGGACAFQTGANNNVGKITLTTGTGPAATGNITLTFSTSIGSHNSQCAFIAEDAAAGWTAPISWDGGAVGASSYVVKFTNGAALTASTSYDVGFMCFGF